MPPFSGVSASVSLTRALSVGVPKAPFASYTLFLVNSLPMPRDSCFHGEWYFSVLGHNLVACEINLMTCYLLN